VNERRIEAPVAKVNLGAGGSVSLRISTRLLLHWARIAMEQELAAREARVELERRRERALATGAGLDLALELRPAMVAATAASSSIDALYGEVREKAGVSAELRDLWRAKGTPRYAQIYETLKRGFHAKREWRDGLQWLFRQQRDAALHATTGYDIPQTHPLGVDTAPEYVIYRCEHAVRAVDLMLEVLATCVERPRPALESWAKDATKPVADLIASRPA
jgi:hypothetical protein